MIKGEIRKRQILETAESLFAERGYEATGVQDILDVLHLSKGSFYHHFESKEIVLQKICENRALLAAMKISGESSPDGLEEMKKLLKAMIPFQGEGLAFLKMILPVFILPEGKSIRAAYQDALKTSWKLPTVNALEKMIQQNQAFTPYPEKTAEIALDLVNDFWAEISEEMIRSEKEGKMASPSQLLSIAEPYRAALENLFSAPYGSIDLIQLEDLSSMVEAIHLWWMVEPAPDASES